MKEAKAIQKTKPAESNSESQGLTRDDLEILKAPFSKDRLGVKVQSVNKDRTRAMLVLYLQHTDVQDRLEQVDPAWTSEVLSETREGDTVYVRSRMTVKGVSRENVGEGGDPKAAYSDALKRCAMLFGIGRYLYDSETVWVDYNESRDRYKQWAVEDYERNGKATAAAPKPSPGLTTQNIAAPKKPPAKNQASGGTSSGRTRDQLNRTLMNLYRPYLTKYPETRFVELLQGRYNVGETRLMSLEQIEDLVKFMEGQLQEVAAS
jgi:hypothetical protein